jgi:hypothetical protein
LRNCKKNNSNKLINENNEEIGELIKLLHINKSGRNIIMDISKFNNNGIQNIFKKRTKSRAASSHLSQSKKNKSEHSELKEDINKRKKPISCGNKENSTNFKSNKSNSISIERNGYSHSKDKKSTSNNLFYNNQKQNDTHVNIVVRDFSNKSKEKIEKNFNPFIL